MDTIGLKFKIEDYPDKSFIEEITPKLNIIFNEGVPLMNFGIPTIKGKLRNLIYQLQMSKSLSKMQVYKSLQITAT